MSETANEPKRYRLECWMNTQEEPVRIEDTKNGRFIAFGSGWDKAEAEHFCALLNCTAAPQPAESAERENADLRAEVERLKQQYEKLANAEGTSVFFNAACSERDRLQIEVERLTKERDEAREKFDKLKLALGTDRYTLAVEVERLTQALAKARFELFKDATDILDPLIPTLGGSVTLGDIALAVKEKCERLTRERDGWREAAEGYDDYHNGSPWADSYEESLAKRRELHTKVERLRAASAPQEKKK